MGGVLAGFFGKYYWGNPDVTYTIPETTVTEETTVNLYCWTNDAAVDYDQDTAAATNYVIL